MELRDYFEAIGAPIQVNFRDGELPDWIKCRFYVTTGAWIVKGSLLEGGVTDGYTADEALVNFAKRWSNQSIKVGEIYFNTGKLVHTKFLNA